MDKFNFYLEFDGKTTHSKAYDKPVEVMMATGINQAIERFCKRKKLDCNLFEALSENAYRTYLVKKSFLKGNTEFVYYIEKDKSYA